MRIIPNADFTRVIIDDTPISIEHTHTGEVSKIVFDNNGTPFEMEKGKAYVLNESINKHASRKTRYYMAGSIESVSIRTKNNPSASLWYIRSHRLSLAYYILGPMLLTETFKLKTMLGVGLCLANIYHKVELDEIKYGHIYVLFRTAMFNKDVYELLSTNDKHLNLTKHENYVEHFQADEYHDMYVFKIPEKYDDVFSLYLSGKWSKFPEDYRQKVYQWAPNTDRAHIWKLRFEKSENLRTILSEQIGTEISKGAELCHAPNGDETFDETLQMPNLKKVNPKDNVTISTERSDGPYDQVD